MEGKETAELLVSASVVMDPMARKRTTSAPLVATSMPF